ncbi:MAG: hypothetical protein EB060_10570, partial [Proteobacteria bacterium]|nr:hypothetical protein [Pseudomonadota bacterium]
MAVEAYELAETRGASLQDGKFSATRKFAIWDDATPLTTPASVTAVFGTTVSGIVIPDVGAIFPGEVDVFCSSYSLEVDSLTRNTWVATFSYAQSEFPFEQGPQQLGYTEFTFDYTAEFRDVYRSNPGLTFPTDGDAGTASYCNGTAISVGDQPMSVLRYFTS